MTQLVVFDGDRTLEGSKRQRAEDAASVLEGQFSSAKVAVMWGGKADMGTVAVLVDGKRLVGLETSETGSDGSESCRRIRRALPIDRRHKRWRKP